MSSSKTSLNGYKYGREPETETPFWGGESGGAEIDDSTTSTVKTWSSKKISDELAEKSDSDDVYTKAQVDELLSEIPAVDAYTKTETDELLAGKAAVTSVYTKAQTYTKTEVDNLLSQIPAVDAYTKAQTDSLLADKANASDVYTKSQVDNLIPDVSGLATKTELNSGLASKANADDVYTKTYLDSEFLGISHAFSDVRDQIDTCAKATAVYTKAQTYTKAEVDDLISGATPAPVDAYTKAQTDSLLAAKADVTALADYAKVTSVYTKTQTYTKAEVDNLIAGAGGSGFSPSIVKKFSILGENASMSGGKTGSFYDDSNLYNVEIEDSSWNWAGTLTVTLSDDTTVSAVISGSRAEGSLRYLPWNSLDATTELPLLDVGGWKTIYIKGIPLRVCVCGYETYSDLKYPYIAIATETGTPVKDIDFTIPSGCHITLETNSGDPYIYRNNGLGIMANRINGCESDIRTLIPNRMRYDPSTGKKQYWQTATYPNSWVDVPESSSGGLDSDSLITFTDTHGLFRYTTNYGASEEFEAGALYNITGNISISIDGTQVYSGGLENVPYNDLASGATQNNILGTAKYLWKDTVITYSSSDGSYVEIPVKIAYIGSSLSNNLYNPYIHIVYPTDCGHTISFECLATNYTKVPSESGGSGGLQEYAYTISSPDSTTISTAITSALIDAITNVGIDNLEKLRKIVAKTEYTFGSTPHVIEHIYDVKYTSISKGGGNFDDIDICAVGGENYYAAGDNIKTTKLIASRYNGILNTVEQSGTNPVVTSTDHSSTNVDSNTSPWYHNQSSPSNLAYKLVFVYG